ncbi:MAG: tryptophan--tRNA ligase [Bacteroidetes bacterium GWE2_29_8]|nr:MAG: tryptophan--tRNA ligase [Bacteroidetes bacterium GWE2_29_8]OFY21062.1 MAG: tryptophan--tRNA ligase [Bacteroidetes bacterium GWF2_29_10]
MDIVVSGIRPTGCLHLGNYFGAVKNFLKMQDENNCYFFIADYHSLTTHPNPVDLHGNVKQVLAEYIACGLDYEKSTIYLQSNLQETCELYLFLNMNAYIGELERCTSFKEKIRKHPDNINAGLFTYPVLMAADILIHRANKVPVGKDQEQHLEMARTFANRFNRIYKSDFFPEPLAYNFGQQLVKIPGLDGTGKMGKSEGAGNAVFLSDSPEEIRKKLMKAVTDSGPTIPNQEKPESIQNLFTLLNVMSSEDTVKYFEDKYNDCTIRYGDLKKQLAEDIINYTNPIREKIKDVYENNELIKKIVNTGTEKAKQSAMENIKQVREIIGFRNF